MSKLENIAKRRKELNDEILKEKRKIREINLSENFKLSEEDQERYESWNNAIKENERGFADIAIPYKDEKDYAIKDMRRQIGLYNYLLVKLICDEKGHEEIKGSSDGGRTFCRCKRCGTAYDRPMSSRESREWDEDMRTPIGSTI
jgi:hypothetical protein